MDAVASLYNRNSLIEIVSRTARDIAIPLTVGGGLRSVDDIREVLRAGADKVAVNTAALARPELIREAAWIFGSSTIVVSIEAIRQPGGGYECFTDCGRQRTGVDAFAWAVRAAELGAGELVVTSVDREGTGKGFDIDLIARIATSVPIPVIACGGAACREHVHEVIQRGRADAVAVASCLHYSVIKSNVLQPAEYQSEGNIEFLKRQTGFSKIQGTNLREIKQYLYDQRVDCRWN
jgi:cyclase